MIETILLLALLCWVISKERRFAARYHAAIDDLQENIAQLKRQLQQQQPRLSEQERFELISEAPAEEQVGYLKALYGEA